STPSDHRALRSFPTRRSSDLIPTAALAQVEVLLDGASAQYGSDAIAGVLNLSLRENSSGGAITATLGTYKEGDGETGAVSGWVGDRKSTRLNSSHVKISYAVF